MGVWVTGDIHGNPTRLNSKCFYEQKYFSGNKDENVVIVLGDFGLVWDAESETTDETYCLDWLESKPFTTVFVDGNHEAFPRLFEYPEKEWRGGRVHEIRPHVLHLMRGEVFTIEGEKFFVFGGASSHDIQDGILDYSKSDWIQKRDELEQQGKYNYRIKWLNWWEEELPTEEEMQHGLDKLKENNNEVDYIITHSPSTLELILIKYLISKNKLYKPDILTDYIDKVMNVSKYKRHYFGHMHMTEVITDKSICLYEQIGKII